MHRSLSLRMLHSWLEKCVSSMSVSRDIAAQTNPLPKDGVPPHFHPSLASQPRRSQSRSHVQALIWSACASSGAAFSHHDVPAPATTLVTPRHNDMYPSALDIVANALPRPVYIAVGDELTTCIRVCVMHVSASSTSQSSGAGAP